MPLPLAILGHAGHDVEELPEVYRCCTCRLDIPKEPDREREISLDLETDGAGVSADVAITKKW